jgi:hypothetical protein
MTWKVHLDGHDDSRPTRIHEARVRYVAARIWIQTQQGRDEFADAQTVAYYGDVGSFLSEMGNYAF